MFARENDLLTRTNPDLRCQVIMGFWSYGHNRHQDGAHDSALPSSSSTLSNSNIPFISESQCDIDARLLPHYRFVLPFQDTHTSVALEDQPQYRIPSTARSPYPHHLGLIKRKLRQARSFRHAAQLRVFQRLGRLDCRESPARPGIRCCTASNRCERPSCARQKETRGMRQRGVQNPALNLQPCCHG